MSVDPDRIRQCVCELSAALRLEIPEVARMVHKQPRYYLSAPVEEVVGKVEELAAALAVEPSVVIHWSTLVPSVLCRTTSYLSKRVRTLSSWLRLDPERTVRVMMKEPEMMRDSYAGMLKRIQALKRILHIPYSALRYMIAHRPDVIFMSDRIVNNKVKVLMSILDKDRFTTGVLVAKCPTLLRRNLNYVREVYTKLPVWLGRPQEYVFAMTCHHPRVLLEPRRVLQQKILRIRKYLRFSAGWTRQWHSLQPAEMEELMSSPVTQVRLQRLEYLITSGQQADVTLVEAVLCTHKEFLRKCPDFVPTRDKAQGSGSPGGLLSTSGSRVRTGRVSPRHERDIVGRGEGMSRVLTRMH